MEAGMIALKERRMSVCMKDFEDAKDKTLYRKKSNEPEGLYIWSCVSMKDCFVLKATRAIEYKERGYKADMLLQSHSKASVIPLSFLAEMGRIRMSRWSFNLSDES